MARQETVIIRGIAINVRVLLTNIELVVTFAGKVLFVGNLRLCTPSNMFFNFAPGENSQRKQ